MASLNPPLVAESLSREMDGRVIAFFLQSNASVEEIVCFDSGARVRRLAYSSDEGGWLHRDGEAQDWEPSYFFNDAHGTGAGEQWPYNLGDELSEEDIARYEEARAMGTAEPILDLIEVGSGHGLLRVIDRFGVTEPHAIYRPPANQHFRWKAWACLALLVAFFVGAFLLGAASTLGR